MHFRPKHVALIWVSAVSTLALTETSVLGDEAAVRETIRSYAKAYNARDIQGVLAHWSAAGVYQSRISGEQVAGHESIAVRLQETFAEANPPKLQLETESIEMISPSVALERGVSTVTRGDEVLETHYRVGFVKSGDKWLLDRVTEEAIDNKARRLQKLKQLEWLLGDWTDEGDDFTTEYTCKWTENQTYLSRTYKVSSAEGNDSSGLQLIGWDANKKQVRSWLFDSEGTFVHGVWSKRGDTWIVQSVATLSDGSSGSYTSIFRPLEEGSYGWSKINRDLDGELLPNVDEVVVKRK